MTRSNRETWSRRIGTPLLLFYVGMLVFAAWPREVRPDFLDIAHQRAFWTLRLFGISAGQPLFQTDASEWKQYGYCLQVRSRRIGGAEEMIYPPGGECQIDGIHLRLPPVERAVHRTLAMSWRKARYGTRGTPESNRILGELGRYFCHQANLDTEVAVYRIEAAWIWYFRNYHTAEVMRRNSVLFAQDCDANLLEVARWAPSDTVALSFWGSEPWR